MADRSELDRLAAIARAEHATFNELAVVASAESVVRDTRIEELAAAQRADRVHRLRRRQWRRRDTEQPVRAVGAGTAPSTASPQLRFLRRMLVAAMLIASAAVAMSIIVLWNSGA